MTMVPLEGFHEIMECTECRRIWHEQFVLGYWRGYKQCAKDTEEVDNIVVDAVNEMHDDYVKHYNETDRIIKESIEEDKKLGRRKYSKGVSRLEYTVVQWKSERTRFSDKQRFENTVNEKMKEGWICQGGIALEIVDGMVRYRYQAMVRDESTEKVGDS